MTIAAATKAPSTGSGRAVFKTIVTRHALGDDGSPGAPAVRKVVSYKAVGSGKPLTEEQLAGINRLAPKALTSEEVYYRPVLLAHNGIDRDNERFHEDLLDSYVKSITGKGFFVEGHPGWSKGGPGKGRIFDAETKLMTAEQFLELTGEPIKLPEGVSMAKVLIVHFYMLKLASNADTQANIDGGIYCFASIGFTAPLFAITDERGNEIYGEYRPKGEALEGSLVWLGAQPGAGATKSAAGAPKTEPEETSKGENENMEKQLAILGSRFGKTFKAETLAQDIILLVGEKDTAIQDLTGKMTALQADAADGKAYRKRLVEDAVKAGVLLGEIKTDEASQKTETDFLMTVPIPRLEVMAGKSMAAARKQFPDKFELPASDQKTREDADTEAAAASGKTAPGGKSPLVADAEKRAAEAAKK